MSRVFLAAIATLVMSQVSFAAPVFVGSWRVDQGPDWRTGPLAYTGQEAAALLFGGSPSDYVISTVDNTVANINNLAWYSVIGYSGNQNNGGSLLAQNYSSKYLGTTYGPTVGYPTGDPSAAASAYVNDNAVGATFTNYAFRVTTNAVATPEPASMTMFGVMLVGGVIGFRRRNAAAKA